MGEAISNEWCDMKRAGKRREVEEGGWRGRGQRGLKRVNNDARATKHRSSQATLALPEHVKQNSNKERKQPSMSCTNDQTATNPKRYTAHRREGRRGVRDKKNQESNIIDAGGVVSSVVDTGRGPPRRRKWITVDGVYSIYGIYVACCVWLGAMTVNNININENLRRRGLQTADRRIRQRG